jgi:predicted O-methyltransferase YrrM
MNWFIHMVNNRLFLKILALIYKAVGYSARKLNLDFFSLSQKLGWHITFNSFYSPIPDTSELTDELWGKRNFKGINMNEQKQLQLLSVFAKFKNEYNRFYEISSLDKDSLLYKYSTNSVFGGVDGDILYCMIRYFKPNKIIEIGSGFSTYLIAHAILENRKEDGEYEGQLVTIDPYPNDTVKAGFPGLSRLIAQKVQDVPLAEFKQLDQNDILFIDSSHVLKIGSDVQYEYLEILPTLNNGVLIQIHDIFLPLEYPKRQIVDLHYFWNEQYILQAFLSFNRCFEVLWGGTYMHLHHRGKLEATFDSYLLGYQRSVRYLYPKNPEIWESELDCQLASVSVLGSFWIRKVADDVS